MMNATQALHFIDTLLKYNNFTIAAQKLYISQPYLTQYIKRIEDQLNTTIIDRSSHPFELTPAGRLYYYHLQTICDQELHFKQSLDSLKSQTATTIQLGVLPSLGTFLLPLFCYDYLQQNTHIKLNINEAIPTLNEQALVEKRIDYYLGQNPELLPKHIDYKETENSHYYAIIPKANPLYQPEKVLLETDNSILKAILSQPLLLTSTGSAVRQQTDLLLKYYQIDPHIVLETSNIYTIVQLAKTQLGIAILPSITIDESFVERRDFNLYPIPEELMSFNCFIAWRKDRELHEDDLSLIQQFQLNTNQYIQNHHLEKIYPRNK